MLFYCVWPDEASFLVDVENLAEAKEAATAEAGKPPSAIVPFVGVFAARLYFENDDSITVDLLEHVEDALEEAEDKLTPDGDVVPPTLIATCPSEADDEQGKVLRCELVAHHADDHKSGELTWPNEKRPSKVG